MEKYKSVLYVHEAKENNTGAAVIVCPGGSYHHLGLYNEGYKTSEWFASKGVTSFTLRYRTAQNGYHSPAMLQDIQRAIQLVRENAEEFGSDVNKLGVIGYSAGGHLVTMACAFWQTHDELEKIVREFISAEGLEGKLELHINPAGDWNQGGFDADTGLTGRKLIVDNYGPRVAIGGGCYSGKDPSKVDRSAAYMARKIAVDYLRKRKAHEVLVRLAYAIGYAEPLEKTVIIDGVPEEIAGYDLTPNGIISYLDLKRPIYEKTACYGHYGEGFDWDK